MLPEPKSDTRFATLQDLLLEWNAVKEKIAAVDTVWVPLYEREVALRSQVMALAFPLLSEACRLFMDKNSTENHAPDCQCGREGVNTLVLPAKFKLKGTIVIDRKVDESVLDSTKEELYKAGVNADSVFRMKPELNVKVYKDLKKDLQKIVDHALVIKPASPKLEIIAPKE